MKITRAQYSSDQQCLYVWHSGGGPLIVPTDAKNADYNDVVASGIKIEPADVPQATARDYSIAIQSHIDDTALGRGYENGFALAGYADQPNPSDTPLVALFKAEGTVFKAWRNVVWDYAYTELDKVQTRQRPMPTIEAFIAELPVITWPT